MTTHAPSNTRRMRMAAFAASAAAVVAAFTAGIKVGQVLA